MTLTAVLTTWTKENTFIILAGKKLRVCVSRRVAPSISDASFCTLHLSVFLLPASAEIIQEERHTAVFSFIIKGEKSYRDKDSAVRFPRRLYLLK